VIKKFLFGSAFAKNIFTLVSYTALAQVINFGFNILLARIYGPSAFGALTVFTSLISFVTVVSCGKYDVAIVAAADKQDAEGLVSLGMWITWLTAIATAIAAWVVYAVPLNFYNQSAVRHWFFVIPVSLVLLSLFQLFWMWNVREKRFNRVSFLRPLEATVNNGVALLLRGYEATGLLIGTIAGQTVSAVLIMILTIRKDGWKLVTYPVNKLTKLAAKYSEFPKINILQGFVDAIQMSIIVLVASAYFSAAEIGYYGMCMRVLQVPVRLIVLPFSHVFFAEASETYREGKDMYGLVKRITLQTGAITIAIPIILLFAGSFLFKTIFGPQWGEAGIYAAALSPWIFFDMLRAPIVQIASILGKQKIILFLTLASNAVLVAVIAIGLACHVNFLILLTLISITQSLVNIAMILVIFNMARNATPQKPTV